MLDRGSMLYSIDNALTPTYIYIYILGATIHSVGYTDRERVYNYKCAAIDQNVCLNINIHKFHQL